MNEEVKKNMDIICDIDDSSLYPTKCVFDITCEENLLNDIKPPKQFLPFEQVTEGNLTYFKDCTTTAECKAALDHFREFCKNIEPPDYIKRIGNIALYSSYLLAIFKEKYPEEAELIMDDSNYKFNFPCDDDCMVISESAAKELCKTKSIEIPHDKIVSRYGDRSQTIDVGDISEVGAIKHDDLLINKQNVSSMLLQTFSTPNRNGREYIPMDTLIFEHDDATIVSDNYYPRLFRPWEMEYKDSFIESLIANHKPHLYRKSEIINEDYLVIHVPKSERMPLTDKRIIRLLNNRAFDDLFDSYRPTTVMIKNPSKISTVFHDAEKSMLCKMVDYYDNITDYSSISKTLLRDYSSWSYNLTGDEIYIINMLSHAQLKYDMEKLNKKGKGRK